MTFIRYEADFGSRVTIDAMADPVVKIVKSGRMSFNKRALEAMKLKDGDDVVLFFDPAMGHIGVRAPMAGDPVSSRLLLSRSPKNSSTAPPGVSAAGFAKKFKIELPLIARIYRLDHDQRTRLWVFALPKGSWKAQASR